MTPDQERTILKLVIKAILERPEIVLEALRSLEAKEKNSKEEFVKQTLREQADEIYRNPDDPIGRNLDGDVTLVEFFDYRCGYCKRVHPAVMKLLKEDGNIRCVYKEFPILGPQSVYAAKAALASLSQGKYGEFSSALMQPRGNLDKRKVLTIAKKIGLNTASLEREINQKPIHIAKIFQQNYKLA